MVSVPEMAWETVGTDLRSMKIKNTSSREETVKNIMMKSNDPYLGLLSYRTSPLSFGLCPAELLMNRRLNTTIDIRRNIIPSLNIQYHHQYLATIHTF